MLTMGNQQRGETRGSGLLWGRRCQSKGQTGGGAGPERNYPETDFWDSDRGTPLVLKGSVLRLLSSQYRRVPCSSAHQQA